VAGFVANRVELERQTYNPIHISNHGPILANDTAARFYKHHRTIDRRSTMKKSWLNTLGAVGAVGTMLALSAAMVAGSRPGR